MKTQESLLAAVALVLLGGLVGYLLISGKDSDTSSGVTTEKAAAAAGAKILPTAPKLQVKPR